MQNTPAIPTIQTIATSLQPWADPDPSRREHGSGIVGIFGIGITEVFYHSRVGFVGIVGISDVSVAWASPIPTFPEPWARPAPSRRAHGSGIVGIVGIAGISEGLFAVPCRNCWNC